MGKKVLVVDDSMVARMFLKNLFDVKAPDWKVLEAGKGSQVSEILLKEDCDIVSIDYNMPDVNGLELAESVREEYPEKKIVILTANIQDSLRRKVENLGILFLEKPITEKTVEFLLSL